MSRASAQTSAETVAQAIRKVLDGYPYDDGNPWPLDLLTKAAETLEEAARALVASPHVVNETLVKELRAAANPGGFGVLPSLKLYSRAADEIDRLASRPSPPAAAGMVTVPLLQEAFNRSPVFAVGYTDADWRALAKEINTLLSSHQAGK